MRVRPSTSYAQQRGFVITIVARLVFAIVHLPGKVNMADILTKAQAVSVFNELMSAYDAYVGAV